MAHPLSRDLRARIVRAVAQGSSIRQAAARFEVSPATAIRLMRRVRATGSTAPGRIGGYRRPLLAGHEAQLRELTGAKPGITLVEIKAALAERGIEAGHISTIWSTLRRLEARCLVSKSGSAASVRRPSARRTSSQVHHA